MGWAIGIGIGILLGFLVTIASRKIQVNFRLTRGQRADLNDVLFLFMALGIIAGSVLSIHAG